MTGPERAKDCSRFRFEDFSRHGKHGRHENLSGGLIHTVADKEERIGSLTK